MPRTRTHRSDAEIFADARKALDGRLTVPEGVHVHVERGVVRLTGSVRKPFERTEAEDAVRDVKGTESVLNEIVVTEVPSPGDFGAPDESR